MNLKIKLKKILNFGNNPFLIGFSVAFGIEFILIISGILIKNTPMISIGIILMFPTVFLFWISQIKKFREIKKLKEKIEKKEVN